MTSVVDTTSLKKSADKPIKQKTIFYSPSHTPQRPNFQRHHTARRWTD